MIDWKNVLKTSIEIMESYDTNVTLRQLFYKLVSRELIKNTQSSYTQLSKRTAEARRKGEFPSFIDKERHIEKNMSFKNPEEAKLWLYNIYRRDRTEGQKYKIYLGVEKSGLVEQLKSWFAHYGISIIALRGYSSQTFIDMIYDDIYQGGRPAILIYAGDFDPSGEDILRDFKERCNIFQEFISIALTPDQIIKYDLPVMMGKTTDTRKESFIKKHGQLVQVELDALDPKILKKLYSDELSRFIDLSIFEKSMELEREDLAELEI